MGFAQSWSAEVLKAPPLIAPARQFIYPLQIAGEEDALGRGALLLMVRPASGGSFLATRALGLTDASVPTGLCGGPNPGEMCPVAAVDAHAISPTWPSRYTIG